MKIHVLFGWKSDVDSWSRDLLSVSHVNHIDFCGFLCILVGTPLITFVPFGWDSDVERQGCDFFYFYHVLYLTHWSLRLTVTMWRVGAFTCCPYPMICNGRVGCFHIYKILLTTVEGGS